MVIAFLSLFCRKSVFYSSYSKILTAYAFFVKHLVMGN